MFIALPSTSRTRRSPPASVHQSELPGARRRRTRGGGRHALAGTEVRPHPWVRWPSEPDGAAGRLSAGPELPPAGLIPPELARLLMPEADRPAIRRGVLARPSALAIPPVPLQGRANSAERAGGHLLHCVFGYEDGKSRAGRGARTQTSSRELDAPPGAVDAGEPGGAACPQRSDRAAPEHPRPAVPATRARPWPTCHGCNGPTGAARPGAPAAPAAPGLRVFRGALVRRSEEGGRRA